MTFPLLLAALVAIMAVFYEKDKSSGLKFPKSIKRRSPQRPIARKARFKLYDNPLKPYKTQPTEDIQRKAEQCRAEQIAKQNPAELRFATILRQLGLRPVHLPAPCDPHAFRYQVILYRTGSYCVPDFALDFHRRIYEIDGKAHDRQEPYDAGKDRWLISQGWKVSRIPAGDVFRRRTDVLLQVKSDLAL